MLRCSTTQCGDDCSAAAAAAAAVVGVSLDEPSSSCSGDSGTRS